ncbi:hypothetical protein MBLNU230_g8424t1 [Neophaeotheca triangularis]
MLTFTPLLGARTPSPASQSLLELDGGVKILIDVGWDECFDTSKLQAIEQHVSTLSLILLTHPTLDHLGAYAHCCKHVPLFSKVPVYATSPVINLGRTLLADLYSTCPEAASIIPIESINSAAGAKESDRTPDLLLQAPTPDETATYFTLINPLKYQQPHQPIPSSWSPSLGGLTITAYCAGHTLGGTIWHIQHGLESIVYAADWNQGRENLFAGAAWLSSSTGGAEIVEQLRRPTALICSSKGVEKTNPLSRKKRDETLIALIRETVAQGGKVLIPSDSSARVLEMAFILNSSWRENIDGPHSETYRNTQIYMASKSSTSTVRYMQSMLEWTEETVMRDAEAAMTSKGQQGQGQASPLDWKFVKMLEKKSQVEKALRKDKPCIMLASDASMQWGFSRQALEELASSEKNLVIMPDRATKLDENKSGLGEQLWDLWRQRTGYTSNQSGVKIVNTDGMVVNLDQTTTTSLEGDETLLYQQYLARQHQLHSSLQGDNTMRDNPTEEAADDQASESSESSDEDEDAEYQGKTLNLSAQLTQSNKRKLALTDAELGINVLLKSKTVHDYDVRNKRGREKVFPFATHKARNDEYGDLIKPEDYLRAEERDDVDGQDMRDGVDHETSLGQKRKWDDMASNAKRTVKDQGNRTKAEREPDDIDAAIARATGEGGGAGGKSEDEESDYEPDEAVIEGPQKLLREQRQVALRLRVAHVDFSGLHEKRDLQMLVPLIRPRKLILIAGEESETQTLAEECRQLLTASGTGNESTAPEVLTPTIGEAIEASVDTNAWTLKLSRQLAKKLAWQNVKGMDIVALQGLLDAELTDTTLSISEGADDGSKRKKLKLEEPTPTTNDLRVATSTKTHASTALMPLLSLLGPSHTAVTTTPAKQVQPVHVGDLRLADLRRQLHSMGHSAEFRGEGTLLVDGAAVVKKSGDGKIELEVASVPLRRRQMGAMISNGDGGLPSFWRVREVVYRGLAEVAGGS